MRYSNSETGFYHMLPRGIGFKETGSDLSVDLLISECKKDLSEDDLKLWNIIFQEIPPSQAADAADVWEKLADRIMNELAKERQNFLALANCAASRLNEVEDTLYIKPAYICKTQSKMDQKILDILLADQDVIFTSNDEAYRISTINDEIKKAWNPLSYNPKQRKEIYYGLSVWGIRSINKGDMEIYISLLDKIFTMAAKNHQNIPDWLQTHCPNELPVDAQIEIFKKMVPKYEITPQICKILRQDVLPEYIKRIKLYSQKRYRPTHISGLKYQAAAKLLISYKARIRRLNQLKEGYQCELKPVLRLDQCKYFAVDSKIYHPPDGVKVDPKIYQFCEDIAVLIKGFFDQIGIPLKSNPNLIEERVAWAIEQDWIPKGLKPVFLTYMTVCCGQGITRYIEYPIQSKLSVYDGRMGKPHQRYAQLMLLSRLCDALSISPEDRLKNWNQYLYWQGKTILSTDEVRFWREQLGKDYESLPAIGFQLCCADYMKDCIPLHLEDLLYDRGSKLWNTGYYNFWTANQAAIQKSSSLLAQKYPKVVTEYRQQRRHAKTYYFTGKNWLNKILAEKIPIDLQEFDSIPECNKNELKRLILETELQLAVCNKARTVLIKLCKKVYDLDSNLFQEFA